MTIRSAYTRLATGGAATRPLGARLRPDPLRRLRPRVPARLLLQEPLLRLRAHGRHRCPGPARVSHPGQVMTRYYGWYASRTRGVRRRQAAEGAAAQEPVAIADPVNWSLRAARYRWAELLRRIYDDSDFTRIPAYLCRRADGEPVDRRDCRGAGCSGAVDFNTATARRHALWRLVCGFTTGWPECPCRSRASAKRRCTSWPRAADSASLMRRISWSIKSRSPAAISSRTTCDVNSSCFSRCGSHQSRVSC